ncbi:MAG: hypothetical protein ISS65_00410 [Desulfobacterales bacterium]|uniref:Mandelate racemase/muconate lactonizing enzyme C-terminal domain-containing protein n=1 Tax=Candidatus Desulfatibia profunda TaxID=2841695 RepID=A0A8J6NYU9_9BACT|nr:hypothetical protein [Candidatus Desulfatibia profunda]MBL7178659.1 hypothetical protein [Desulfobacterales bacterium]
MKHQDLGARFFDLRRIDTRAYSMQIDQVKLYPVSLPFSDEFSHSLRKRLSANNIIVEVIAEKGAIKGYGEGAPRSYVTGESQDSAVESICRFARQDNFPWELNDVSQIWDFVDRLSNGKDQNSAICAIETALLDAVGKHRGTSIIEYFPKDFLTGSVFYGAGIPLVRKSKILEFSRLIKSKEIHRLKLKMGKDYAQNKEIIETVHHVFGDDCELKVDVNGVWNRALAYQHIPLLSKYEVKVLEQPMTPNDSDLADFAGMLQSSGVTLMADESACSLKDIKKIVKEGCYKMINIRLSKCGGIRNSLKLINYLRQNRIHFQIGCHMGESGLLSAVGRVLCLLCGDALFYEGSYDEFMLKENITFKNVTFGSGGKAGPLNGFGLGVEVDPQRLKRLSKASAVLMISRP